MNQAENQTAVFRLPRLLESSHLLPFYQTSLIIFVSAVLGISKLSDFTFPRGYYYQ
jgi:hypothetical protein